MRTYKVAYKETLIHTFYIEANNINEAENTFNQFLNHGEIDFSDGQVVDSEIMIEEDN